MLKKMLLAVAVVALSVVALNVESASASDEALEEITPSELFKAALTDAHSKGLIADSRGETWISFVGGLIAIETGETPGQVRERLSLDVAPWEGSFPVLRAAVEEASLRGVLGDKHGTGFSAWAMDFFSAWFINYLIAPNTGETAHQVRMRLAREWTAGPRAVSDTLGTRANPAPVYVTAMAPNGVAVTVLSSNLAASTVIEGWGEANAPPSSGRRYVAVRVRAEGIKNPYIERFQSFGLIGSSGRIIRNLGHEACDGSLDYYYPGFQLRPGEATESVLCFQAPLEEKGLTLFYEVGPDHWIPGTIQGFWGLSDDETQPAPTGEATAISEDFGTLAKAVPLGRKALADDGLALMVLSASMDANQTFEESSGVNYVPPQEGNKYITIRARIEDFSGGLFGEHTTRGTYLSDFGIVTSSGRIRAGAFDRMCRFAPGGFASMDLFKGGWLEGDLCFEISDEETAVSLFYAWRGGLGFWDIAAKSVAPAPVEPPTAISKVHGSRENPVPVGEKGLASDGIAITIRSAEPSPEGGLLTLRLRVEYFGEENAQQHLDSNHFGLVTASGFVVHGNRYTECAPYSYGLRVGVFRGGWQAGDVCFDVPTGEVDPTLFYLPEGTDRVLGFWAVSPDFEPPPAREAPRSVSGGYGTFANPVPAGEEALASNGIAITVLSAVTDASILGYQSSDAHTSALVRVGLESFDEDANRVRRARVDDFGVASASGILGGEDVRAQCHWDGDALDAQLFQWGREKGSLCFNVPVDEAGPLSIYFKPEGADEPLGFWAIPERPAVPGIPVISDTFGTLQNPVPLGTRALVSGGLAVSVVATDLDILAHNRTPDEGNRYLTLRARVENFTGIDGLIRVSERDFGVVTQAGQILYVVDHYHVYRCGKVPDRLDGVLAEDGSAEGNLCFQVPISETEGLSLYYAPSRRIQGIWALSADAASHAVPEPGKPVSDHYGTRAAPVPMGDKAVVLDGHAITVLAVNMNASHTEHRDYSHTPPEPPPPGEKYAVARIRVENHTVPDHAILSADWDDYGVITQSGTVIFGHDERCPYTRHSIYRNVMFRHGFAEGDLCFLVPENETGLTLFYRSEDRTLGFWSVGQPQPGPLAFKPRPPAVSGSYGTWRVPVPLGEAALASNGVAIRVVDVLDHSGALEESGGRFPSPDFGAEYAVVRVRIENLAGHDPNELTTVSHGDFALVTASSGRMTFPREYGCARDPHSLDVIFIRSFPDQLTDAYLFENTSVEANLCFQIPIGETVQSVVYRPGQTGLALGFWAVSNDGPPPDLNRPGTPISASYGRLTTPVPHGEKALASDGIAITVLSANLNADQVVEDAWVYNSPPEPGNKYIIVRVRVENTAEDLNELRRVGSQDFGITLAAGLARDLRDPYHPNPVTCAWQQVPDELQLFLFGGMSDEGNLCFQVPIGETEPSIFYMPFDSVAGDQGPTAQLEPYDPAVLDPYVLGYWALPTE